MLPSALQSSYPRLRFPPGLLNKTVESLERALGHPPSSTQDRSDLRQIATALVADIPVVITRDRRARSRLAKVAFDLGEVVVTTPAELVAIALAGPDTDAYVPSALRETAILIHEVRPEQIDDLNGFLATNASETTREFKARLDCLAVAAPNASRRLIEDDAGEPLAICGAHWSSRRFEVPILRVAASGLQNTLAVQLTEELRRSAIAVGRSEICVTDPHIGRSSRSALIGDGFIGCDDGTLAGITIAAPSSRAELDSKLAMLAQRGTCSARYLERLRHDWNAATAAELEHDLRPCRIVDAPIPTWIVPIRPEYADDLFGYPLNLLSRPTQLGLGLEQVYYRGGRSGEQVPGRVLWRSTGKAHEGIFACSSLIEVRDGTPEALYRRFRQLGAWNLDQMKARVTGTARALKVRDTHLFQQQIPLSRLRSIAKEHGQGLQLQSPCRVDARLFEVIVRAGAGG